MKRNHHHIPKTLENAGEFRMFIYEFTESKIFSGSILFVILLNTAILVVQTDEGVSVRAGKWADYNCHFFLLSLPYLHGRKLYLRSCQGEFFNLYLPLSAIALSLKVNVTLHVRSFKLFQ